MDAVLDDFSLGHLQEEEAGAGSGGRGDDQDLVGVVILEHPVAECLGPESGQEARVMTVDCNPVDEHGRLLVGCHPASARRTSCSAAENARWRISSVVTSDVRPLAPRIIAITAN